jgi:hypothetical protein
MLLSAQGENALKNLNNYFRLNYWLFKKLPVYKNPLIF